MSKRIEINPGERYNRLTIICEVEAHIQPSGQKQRKVKCVCDCGNIVDVTLSLLRRGHTKSCGCYQKEIIKKMSICNKYGSLKSKHRMCNTSEYRSWNSMKERCLNKNYIKYNLWGGRGITICDRWLNSFENFYADMGPKPGPEYSLDRINNNGNYEPSNCRWATPKEQVNNRRISR